MVFLRRVAVIIAIVNDLNGFLRRVAMIITIVK